MRIINRLALLLGLTGAAGAALGFFGGRSTGADTAASLKAMADLLERQVTLNTYGAVVSSGLAAAAIIVGAVLVPAVVTFVIHHQTKDKK